MSWYRKNPLFASVMTLCAVVALGEVGCIAERYLAWRKAGHALADKRAELARMAELTPPPSRPVAAAIEADLERAHRALATMQAELTPKGAAAERLQKARVPAARTDAYFDLATFVEKTRELAKKDDVDVRPDAARFGFATYVNEGPDQDRIEPVFRQRQVVQYLLENLFEAHPHALLAVKRELPLTKAERDARDAAATGGAPGGDAAAAADVPAPPGEDDPDLFQLDPRASIRVPGYVDSLAFRLAFTGQTTVLRSFLDRLAGFDLPIIVREIEVEPAPADEPAAGEEVTASAESAPPTAAPKPVPVARHPRSTALPIVPRGLSKFTVTVECASVVPPANSNASEAAPAAPTS